MKLILAFLSLGCAMALTAAPAETTTTAATTPAKPAAAASVAELPTVDQILANNIKAMGGKEAIQKITTRTIKGSLDIPAMGISAISWEQYIKAPNKRLTILEIPGMGTMLDGFDGVSGWSKGQGGNVQDKKGEELGRLKRESEFYRELKMKELYSQLTVKGKEKVGNGETYVVEAKPTRGAADKFYYDTQTGLMARWDSSFENDNGKVSISVVFKDHQTVDGLKLPFATAMEITPPDGQVINIEFKCKEIRHNTPIEDSKFQKPAE